MSQMTAFGEVDGFLLGSSIKLPLFTMVGAPLSIIIIIVIFNRLILIFRA